ncbi:hypothetical protein GOP47_0004711 [Adiantum capillus-veneris]|uniref:Peptidase S26 domain-containing protein n=2 Tax=Adiantum capillus-veneris TaxID=13818 RepID=A0A9D4V9D7_ADICA|nr:hypothetical protein GOP47_0004711 [Adiantum capillus-veneris]
MQMLQWCRTWKPIGREICERSVLFIQFFCCLDIFKEHVAEISQVVGPSMLPTFSATGDVLVVERLSTRFQRIKQGDVVMAASPENPRLIVCKRVLGLEGERVVVMPTKGNGRVQHVQVPKGHVWLQGDNTSNSTDSRDYGPVPYGLLRGKVCLRVWPPNGWTRF